MTPVNNTRLLYPEKRIMFSFNNEWNFSGISKLVCPITQEQYMLFSMVEAGPQWRHFTRDLPNSRVRTLGIPISESMVAIIQGWLNFTREHNKRIKGRVPTPVKLNAFNLFRKECFAVTEVLFAALVKYILSDIDAPILLDATMNDFGASMHLPHREIYTAPVEATKRKTGLLPPHKHYSVKVFRTVNIRTIKLPLYSSHTKEYTTIRFNAKADMMLRNIP
jgi:hypothetical protein